MSKLLFKLRFLEVIKLAAPDTLGLSLLGEHFAIDSLIDLVSKAVPPLDLAMNVATLVMPADWAELPRVVWFLVCLLTMAELSELVGAIADVVEDSTYLLLEVVGTS